MRIKSFMSVGVVSIASLAISGQAQAAALQGSVGINPPSPAPGSPSVGVRFIGTAITAPDGAPLTDLDFVPPFDGGVGPVVELNANEVTTPEGTFNDFAPFVGFTGEIQDLTVAQTATISSATPLVDFITVDTPNAAFAVDLTTLEFPQYTFDGSGTTVSVGALGNFRNLSDGSNDVSQGVGTFSVDFAGLDIAETQALFDEPGEIPRSFDPGTWSSNWVVTAEPNVPVPEASNMLGLLAVGLAGAATLARKKK